MALSAYAGCVTPSDVSHGSQVIIGIAPCATTASNRAVAKSGKRAQFWYQCTIDGAVPTSVVKASIAVGSPGAPGIHEPSAIAPVAEGGSTVSCTLGPSTQVPVSFW